MLDAGVMEGDAWTKLLSEGVVVGFWSAMEATTAGKCASGLLTMYCNTDAGCMLMHWNHLTEAKQKVGYISVYNCYDVIPICAVLVGRARIEDRGRAFSKIVQLITLPGSDW